MRMLNFIGTMQLLMICDSLQKHSLKKKLSLSFI